MEKRERQSLERHQSSITNIANALDTLKSAVEEKKFTKGEREDEIKSWSEELEKHLEKADHSRQATDRIQSEIKAIDMEEQEKRAFDNHKQQMEYERDLGAESRVSEKTRTTKSRHRSDRGMQVIFCRQVPQIIHHEVQWKDRRVAPVLGEIRFRNRFH